MNSVPHIYKRSISTMTAKKPTDNLVNLVKSPLSFKEFAKEPVKGLLFIVIVAVGYLYVDGKVNYTKQIESQNVKIEKLERKIETLSEQLRKSDSALAAALSKISVLQDLGKIK